jgi:hypothetical protein
VQFRYHPVDQLLIDSVSARLTEAERFVRRKFIEQIVNSGGPVGKAAASDWLPGHDVDVETVVSSLIRKRAVVIGETDEITFVYPVSALPTRHKVRLQDGRAFSAMCAIDALGSTFTFHQDVSIASACSYCDEPVAITIQNGEIRELQPATTHVLHADLNRVENWATSC